MERIAIHGPYMLPVVLVTIGVYALIAHRNYVKTIVGLFLVQSGMILFFIVLAAKRDGTVPILLENGERAPLHNPLPHAMMLTAIVVGFVTLGVAMAILRRLQVEAGSIQQPEPEPGEPARIDP